MQRRNAMSYLPKERYKRILVISAYIIIALTAGYVTLKYLLKPFLPFVAAWITAMLLRPMINRICRRTKLPRKAVSVICLFLVFLLIFGLLTVVCGRLLSEMRGIAENLMSDATNAVGDVFDYIDSLSDKLPFLDRIENRDAAERVQKAVVSMIEGAVASFSAKIPEAVMSFASSLPGMILFAVVFVAATFYMGADVTAVNAFIATQLPASSRHHLFEAKKKLATAGIKYVKAYLMILFITFVQLLIGFLCLQIPYALTLAAVIALIDILPVLGVGTVLIPWSAVLLIRGEVYTGVGLLIVFAVIWTVRQVAEPRIVGHSTGISPLVTLIAMYTGYQFMGFSGLFVFPLVVILLKNLSDIGVIRLWKEEITPEKR